MTSQLLFFLLTVLIHSHSASSKLFLHKGSSLLVKDNSDFLTSADNTFTCGFHQVGINAYCFSIWFTNSADRTIVWTVNRDHPVNGRGSKVSLRGSDGTMLLSDIDGSIIWSTNTTNTKVNNVELLNTGNLVLKDPQGRVLWQSFDSPTDTFLPSQPINRYTKLVSRKNNKAYSTGHFSFFYNNDNTLRLLYDGPQISSLYWPNPKYDIYQNGRTNYNSKRTAVFDEMGMFNSSDKTQFNSMFDWNLCSFSPSHVLESLPWRYPGTIGAWFSRLFAKL